jgi:hypothetical protein
MDAVGRGLRSPTRRRRAAAGSERERDPIPTRIVKSVRPRAATPRQVARAFRARVSAGASIVAAGEAQDDPGILFSSGYTPRYEIDLFETAFYLTDVRQNEDIRFFVAYVAQRSGTRGRERIHPRIFYKDVSLVWRSASHFVRSAGENWIGKGAIRTLKEDGELVDYSDEATTNLPLEMQTALETLCRRARRIPHDETALYLVLRRGPDDRIAPYRDFTEPRRRAQSDPRNLVNGGRRIARFARRNDPTSLVFARGFEPDFVRGTVEVAHSTSRLYGGRLSRYRILSRNRRVQYLFFAGPRQVWIGDVQATTTELSSFGVRTIDVAADEDLTIPGYEYHFVDQSGPRPILHSQIPRGHVGAPSDVDPSRADASPWLDRMPVIREFRRRVQGRPTTRRRKP